MDFVTLFQSTQNSDCLLNGWRLDHNWLETTLEGGILLYVLAVLIECGGSYEPKFAPRQHRFEHV